MAVGRGERGRKGRASHCGGRVYMRRERVIVRKVKGRVTVAHRERRARQCVFSDAAERDN